MKKFTFLLFLLLVNPTGHTDDKVKKPVVVASIKPLALIARDLAGDWLQIQTLLADNQEPHHVSLSISQRRKVQESDLVLWVSPHLETFLVKLLAPLEKQKLLSFQETLPANMAQLYDHDFHYWLAPDLATGFYRAVADRLKILFPEQQENIDRQLEKKLLELSAASNKIESILSAYSGQALIVDHQAYGYFTEAYNVNVKGALVDESGVPVGPRTMASLADHDDISCIAVERLPPSRRAAKMAAIVDTRIVAIDPLGLAIGDERGYVALLDSVAKGFASCFHSSE